jgi:hypothetical protein
MSVIAEYIKSNTIENLKNMVISNPFKVYKPLDQGNSKLNKNIFSFSLIPVSTCVVNCAGCYDKRSLRYPSVRDKRQYNTFMAINETEKLKSLIVKQILSSRTIEFVRIHVGGDFFSIDYLTMWAEIVSEVKKTKSEIKFYTYTKTKFTDELEMAGINVVASKVKGLGFNFAELDKLENFVKENKEYTICPATVKATKDSTKCGVTCTACMDKSEVLFVKH